VQKYALNDIISLSVLTAQPSPDGGVVRWNMPRCWYCSSATMSAVLRMGPAGTRAVFMAARTSSNECAAIHVPITCSERGYDVGRVAQT